MRVSNFLALIAIASSHVLAEETLFERTSNWTVGQTVQTSSGPVEGHPAANQSEVSEYLGIPYGQAPIGDLRWEAPQKFEGNTTLNGSSFGYSCPVESPGSTTYTSAQLRSANSTEEGVAVLDLLSDPAQGYSEDCLNLNVWTKPQVGETKKAVMVFIYGGGFNTGSSAATAYNGANWPELEDVVLVTFNYRLNIFGFPGNPSITNNLGLLDQRLAVEWVQENIENFGGDPTRITLFGQSAGAASVDFYSYAWASDPIVAGLIPESGNVFSWGLPNSKATSTGAWFSVTSNLQCGNENSADQAEVLACMKTKSTDEIFAGFPTSSVTSGVLGYFGPTVDGTVVFANYSTITPANVPMLIGNNDYEAGLFRTTFAFDGVFLSDTFWNDFNLQEFTCPSSLRANVSMNAGFPIWRYRYFGVFPDLAVSTEASTWHASEVPLLFATTPSTIAATEEELTFASYMRGAWATFAKNPQTGLSTYGTGWPLYNTSHDTLIRLYYDNVTETNLINPYRYDADCPFVNVSNSDPAEDPPLPSLGLTVTPTATGTTASFTTTGTATGTGTGTAASASATKKSRGNKVSASFWLVLCAFATAYFL